MDSIFLYVIFNMRCFGQGFTFPVTELFLEDVLEKTRYKIRSECDSSAGSSRKKRFSSVKSDPLSDLFEVNFIFFFLSHQSPPQKKEKKKKEIIYYCCIWISPVVYLLYVHYVTLFYHFSI